MNCWESLGPTHIDYLFIVFLSLTATPLKPKIHIALQVIYEVVVEAAEGFR